MDILERLSYYKPDSIQKMAIDEVLNDPSFDYSILVLPNHLTNTWENCALILSQLKDEQLIPYLPKIFEWFKDINWPGAETMCTRIKQIPFNKIKHEYFNACEIARSENDVEWLAYLKERFEGKIED